MDKKPALPERFTAPSTLGTLAFAAFTLAMFFLPALLSCKLILDSTTPMWLALCLSLPLLVIAGQGMHLMGWMGHDGLHFNLHRNRLVSAWIGIFISAGTVTFLEMGMALDHWTHHRYTNRSEDPDLQMFAKYRSFWPRMLLTRMRSNRHYLRRVWKLITNQPLATELKKIVLPFSERAIRRLALFNVSCNLLWIIFFGAIAWYSWQAFLIVFVAPLIFAAFLSGLRPYIEHNGTGIGELDNTRSRTATLWTVLDFGANYHAEHHLYPNVPQWRLPALHRYLRDQGCIGEHHDPSAFAHYRYATRQYQYPSVQAQRHSDCTP